MLSNKEVAKLFSEVASLMELHGENTFKTRSYANAYINIRKIDQAVLELSGDALLRIPGIGEAIADKILEIGESGTFSLLEKYRAMTPVGVREILGIKGLGPKKVLSIWKEMEIETPGELLYACEENRLINYKGFGAKTQEEIRKNLEYYFDSQHSFLYATVELAAQQILEHLQTTNPGLQIAITGAFRKQNPVLETIDFVANNSNITCIAPLELNDTFDENITAIWDGRIPVRITCSTIDSFGSTLLATTGGSELFYENYISKIDRSFATEQECFNYIKKDLVHPALRDQESITGITTSESDLIQAKDIRGVIHTHTTWSDGLYSIDQMAQECIRLGYQYLVISDHSQSAFYAGGLKPERLPTQWKEIDDWNTKHSDFKIFKSIESDILNDGSLDYEADILEQFDLVIASIHSVLKMDIEKATNRLIKAIENPHTRILGHPTGRLLLSRKGYPIDFIKVIDACDANKVSIELNANPLRLDLDWTWLQYAMSKHVYIGINPDAHNLRGIQDIKYGVLAAQKGGLTKAFCLNHKDLKSFENWLQQRV